MLEEWQAVTTIALVSELRKNACVFGARTPVLMIVNNDPSWKLTFVLLW